MNEQRSGSFLRDRESLVVRGAIDYPRPFKVIRRPIRRSAVVAARQSLVWISINASRPAWKTNDTGPMNRFPMKNLATVRA
jgi:hypothetical protein